MCYPICNDTIMKGGRVLWVPCNVKSASVCGNEGIPAHKPLCRETEVEPPEDVPESFREELCPLLDESGSRGDLIGQETKMFQQFMADAATFHAEKEMDQLYKPQFPVTGKVLSWVFDKLGSVAGHVVHDRPERGLDLLWE